jgi:hypothetical protein
MRLIRTNFNLAVGINTAILGGAILGWLSPVASAVLHNGTTIGILLNALAGVSQAPGIGAQARGPGGAIEGGGRWLTAPSPSP